MLDAHDIHPEFFYAVHELRSEVLPETLASLVRSLGQCRLNRSNPSGFDLPVRETDVISTVVSDTVSETLRWPVSAS